jgi:hypothetical protein
MISNLGNVEYREKIIEASSLAKKLGDDTSILADLRAAGIEYVYIGEKGNITEPGLNAMEIAKDPQAELVYNQRGVAIFKIREKSAGR